jgi:pimeloyl-ACP methyl ester carboxylesterase
VIFRNCDQQRGSVTGIAEQLRGRGFHVLTYDYRGGLAPGKNWSETRQSDMVDLHAWLVRQPGVDSTRLVAIGGSCGVQAALTFAQQFGQNVRAVVLMSGPAQPNQLAFLRSAAEGPAVFGLASLPEGAPHYIEEIVAASKHKATRTVIIEKAAHGTFILEDTPIARMVLDWLDQLIR